jgi:superfamily II DNA or RNA helicase
VAVQAIIEWLKGRGSDATVLWIAQSDELCEQSVESWLQAWRALGPMNGSLRINRMWGTTNEKARTPEAGSTVVVATFQTLANRVGRSEMEWVFTPDLVVIDEAHGAIAPSFTRILQKVGITQRETRCPLIGLTATPFRGEQDERETMRLAFRFEYRRFDIGRSKSEDLYQHLQECGVLAHADHEELLGEHLSLSSEELSLLETYMRLPSAVEARLAGNEDRNERILNHVKSRPADWPILLFSASVEHAEDLAVRLNMDGVTASAITGSMLPARRRHAIEAFKSGRIRILTNYGVLTTGFDAPAVRAVYVTRPVYSPLLYQQMIGRGLRGPLNGGKERCLIVNVADNVRQYGHELAFRRFEYLWNPELRSVS